MKLYRHLYTTEQGFSVLEVNAKEVTTRNELRCKKLYSFATNDGTTINQAQDIKPKPDVSIAFIDEFTVFDSIPFQAHSIICFILFESPDLDKFTKMVTVELQRVIDSANDSINSATKSLIGSVRWHEETKIALQTAQNWQNHSAHYKFSKTLDMGMGNVILFMCRGINKKAFVSRQVLFCGYFQNGKQGANMTIPEFKQEMQVAIDENNITPTLHEAMKEALQELTNAAISIFAKLAEAIANSVNELIKWLAECFEWKEWRKQFILSSTASARIKHLALHAKTGRAREKNFKRILQI